eukprot:GHUV01034771.1.p1 GENE.GHUV01034771.1~~GHUV01034771.1.p1  ORF type:complete len:100 (-),score=1.37 GHUV01034771.1:451-750(-)
MRVYHVCLYMLVGISAVLAGAAGTPVPTCWLRAWPERSLQALQCPPHIIAGQDEDAGLGAYPRLPSSFATTTLTDVEKPGYTIPQSFMGFSHEWPYVEE